MKITWLAAADARGHLMRAHLMRGLGATRGLRVEIVTTSLAGQAFLAALGTPSTLLSDHYGVAFDERQNMARTRTERCVAAYFLSPARGAADWRKLEELSRGSALVVNDFHPLLLAGANARDSGMAGRIVHVFGENLWGAIERNFAERGPGFVDRRFTAAMRALRDRARATIEHTLEVPHEGESDVTGRHLRLLPVVALPRRSRQQVRERLGITERQKLAAVYLNPHFSDPRTADAIEGALDACGYRMHAVSEGFATRARFRAYDGDFADVVAASDVLVSAPGMAAVGHARMLGLPFVALLTDQPEQRANVSFLLANDAPFASVDLIRESCVQKALSLALDRVERGSSPSSERASRLERIEKAQARWVASLETIARISAPPVRTLRRRSTPRLSFPPSIPIVP